MKISVIIPTYNRKATLTKSINSLLNQKNVGNKDFEIIIVDDGSTDSTVKVIKPLITVLRQKHLGPAAARNLGIKNANGQLVLFLGDDIIATPNLLEEHIKWHSVKYKEESVAVLGYITWSKDIKITPFMHWLENGGFQFNYPKIKGKIKIDYEHFYSSNISLKRKFLFAHGLFDERFPNACWEDMELGFRLQKKGLKIYYNKNAIGYHQHFTTIKDAKKRMVRVGKSLKILHQLHPSLRKEFSPPTAEGLVKLSLSLPLGFISSFKKDVHEKKYFKIVTDYYFYKGYRKMQ